MTGKQENLKWAEKFYVIYGDLMSRIGKIPVVVPSQVKVNIQAETIQLDGPKGKLSLKIPEGIQAEFKDQQFIVTRREDTKQSRSNHGTIRAHLVNMIQGVTQGHKKELEIQGIGFRAQLQAGPASGPASGGAGKILFNLGFSHPVEFQVPKDIKIVVNNQTNIVIEGSDITLVGQTAANIRDLKPVEPYKGKGIRYVGEFVKRKQGKSVTK